MSEEEALNRRAQRHVVVGALSVASIAGLMLSMW